MAPGGGASPLDRRRLGSTPHAPDARRQGNRRTPGGSRQHEAILSLYAGLGWSCLAVFGRDRCQAEGKRLSGRMARRIPGQQATQQRRPNHGVAIGRDGPWEPEGSLWSTHMTTLTEPDLPRATDGEIA